MLRAEWAKTLTVCAYPAPGSNFVEGHVQGWLEPAAGILLMWLALLDLFLTVSYARAGAGYLSDRVAGVSQLGEASLAPGTTTCPISPGKWAGKWTRWTPRLRISSPSLLIR